MKFTPITKRAALVRALLLFTFAQPLTAASLTWDADLGLPGAQDGLGTWNLANTNWFDGTSNVMWSNGAPAFDATFGTGGTAGVVTLGTGITAGSLTCNSAT